MGRDFKRDSYRKYLGFWHSAKSHFVKVKNPKRKRHEQIEFCDECLKEAFEQSTINSPEACDLLLNTHAQSSPHLYHFIYKTNEFRVLKEMALLAFDFHRARVLPSGAT